MKIASHQLAAFFEVANARSFSRAADRLNITQSALSQRVANLEKDLEATLFIRDSAGPRLTEAGEFLLRYCQTQSSLEQEVLSRLKKTGEELTGVIRIAGFSSVLRSVIMPAMAKFLRTHPAVQCEFRNYQVSELYPVLRNAEADFIVLDYHLNRNDICESVLGREEYVLIESTEHNTRKDIYLDNDPDDNATESFFQMQSSTPKKFLRAFMGDVYGILNGVELGLGRAVMSRHLLKESSKTKIVGGYKKYFRDITLNYYQQAYYSDLHKKIIDVLNTECSKYL